MKNMQKYEQLAITELDAYLFGQGTHYEIYNKMRSEERRVGKECRSRWSPYH